MIILELLESGISVFPLIGRTKKPAVLWNKYRTEYIEQELIEEHQGNFGIVTGKLSGIVVLDADNTKAAEWIASNYPTPYKVKTPRGKHFYYKWNGETNRVPHDFPEGIDIRGEGGYVVAPESINTAGIEYLLEIGEGFEGLEDLPNLELDFKQINVKLESATKKALDGEIKSGERNNILSQVAFRLAINDFGFEESVQIMYSLNENQGHPLNENEVYNLVEAKFKAKAQGRLHKTIEVENLQSLLAPDAAKETSKLPRSAGIINDLTSFISSTAFLQQEAFSFSAAISLLSILSGNIYSFDSISPNLYIFNVGNSGTGKNAPQLAIKNILYQLGRLDLLGDSKYASAIAMIESLPSKRQRLDIIDEASGQFNKAVASGAQSFQSDIVETINELYTSSNSYFAGERSRTHGVTGACWNPFVTMLASTTQSGFKGFFNRDLISKGIGGRLTLFSGNPNPELNKNKLPLSAFKDVRTALADIAELRPIMKDSKPKLQEVAVPDKSRSLWLEYIEAQIKKNFQIDDPVKRALRVRIAEQANKFALIHAVGCNPLRPSIRIQDIEFGTATAEYCYKNISEFSDYYIADTQQEAITKEALQIVKELKSPTLTQIKRRMRHISPFQVGKIIEGLIDTEDVLCVMEKEAKIQKKVYILK